MANRPCALSEFQAGSIAARLDLAEGESADQKTTQTTLPRRPTSTMGSDVSRSSSRNGGARAPTAGGSFFGSRLVRSQAAPSSEATVTTTMMAVIPSIRRLVGMSLASSINLPRVGEIVHASDALTRISDRRSAAHSTATTDSSGRSPWE